MSSRVEEKTMKDGDLPVLMSYFKIKVRVFFLKKYFLYFLYLFNFCYAIIKYAYLQFLPSQDFTPMTIIMCVILCICNLNKGFKCTYLYVFKLLLIKIIHFSR